MSEWVDIAVYAALLAAVFGWFPAWSARVTTRVVADRNPVWEPGEQKLLRVTLPLWISMIATEPIPLEALARIGNQGPGALLEVKQRGNELNIRVGDLERYGRTCSWMASLPTGCTS